MNPYLILGAVAACIACAYGGYTQGQKAEKSVWLQKEVQYREAALIASNQARDKERQYAEATAQAATTHAAALSKLRREMDRENAALRDGSLRLRVPVASCSPAPEAGPTTPGSAGRATAELPPETSQALLSLGREADEVVLQLQLCQQIAKKDRE